MFVTASELLHNVTAKARSGRGECENFFVMFDPLQWFYSSLESDLWYKEFITQFAVVYNSYKEDGDQPYKLTNFLKERTKINNLLNERWAEQADADYLCLIKGLWDRDYIGPGFDEAWWVLFNMPQIRVNLADLLIQSSNHKLLSIDRNTIRSELITYIDRDLFNTKAQAIRALAQLGDDRDLDYLQKLADSEDPKGYSSVARAAIRIHQQVSAARVEK